MLIRNAPLLHGHSWQLDVVHFVLLSTVNTDEDKGMKLNSV